MMGAEAVAQFKSYIATTPESKLTALGGHRAGLAIKRVSDPIGRGRHLGSLRATLRKEMDRLALLRPSRSNSHRRARHCKRSAHRFLSAQSYCRVTRSTRLQRCDFSQTYEIRQDAHRVFVALLVCHSCSCS